MSLLLPGDAAEQVDERLVRGAGFRGEAGGEVAEVADVEAGALVDGAGEESPAEGAEGTKPMPSSSSVGTALVSATVVRSTG